MVAVSGGPDSVALLHILMRLRQRLKIKLGVIHYEHGIRGVSSLRDARFTRNLAFKLGLPFYIGHGQARDYARQEHLSLEMAARELRYAFFEKILKQTGANRIALGHTADDQVEEILRRFLRGTAWAGFGGMEVKRGPYIRPLLNFFKHEILAFLKKEKIEYVIDETNYDQRFLRNRIRMKLIPLLLKFNPAFKENLLEMARIWREDNAWIEKQVDEIEAKCVLSTDLGLKLDLERLAFMDRAIKRRLLHRVLQKTAFRSSKRHLNALLELAFPGGPHKTLILPDNWKAYKENKWLYITQEVVLTEGPSYHYVVDKPGKVKIKELNLSLEIKELSLKDLGKMALTPHDILLDSSKVCFPLEIRPYQPGDRFSPLPGITKKIKDFFIDQKIPYSLRKKIPIFLSEGKVISIADLRADAKVTPGPETERYLLIRRIQGQF